MNTSAAMAHPGHPGALWEGRVMDDTRLNAASLGLKNCQQRLLRLLTASPGEPARADIAEALHQLVAAQDGFIVLRESMLALEFENAALRERLAQTGSAPSPAPGRSPLEVNLR